MSFYHLSLEAIIDVSVLLLISSFTSVPVFYSFMHSVCCFIFASDCHLSPLSLCLFLLAISIPHFCIVSIHDCCRTLYRGVADFSVVFHSLVFISSFITTLHTAICFCPSLFPLVSVPILLWFSWCLLLHVRRRYLTALPVVLFLLFAALCIIYFGIVLTVLDSCLFTFS